MQLKHFFQLIRWKNLVLIALMQFLIKYYFFSPFYNQTTLSNNLFGLLVFTTIIITASGYIINDIFDLKTDAINKPKKVIIQKYLSLLNAKKLYAGLTLIGILSGIILTILIDSPISSLYFLFISITLFFYSKCLKGKVLIGNIIVSTLLSFSIFILLILDTPISLNASEWNLYYKVVAILTVYGITAFLLNLAREVIKDIEDVDGDYNQGYKTYPILYGRKRARNLTLFISAFTVIYFFFMIFNHLRIGTIAFGYLFIFVFLPLLYFCIKLYQAKINQQYSFLSNLLKIIILTGVLSIPIISNYFINAFE